MNPRTASVERKSKETEIKIELNVDGRGESTIKTPIGLLNHMLELFAFHGLFDLNVDVQKADTEIDIHHTNEDIGIVLGKVFKKALGEMQGIRRFGWASAPMEATLATCVIDISGRGSKKFNYPSSVPGSGIKDNEYSFEYVEHFFDGFVNHLGATINFKLQNLSDDLHTNIETVFKSFGLALDQATQIDPRRQGEVPSTKGIID